jgi:single-stranded-DNA-specific exonuclease
MQKTWNIKEREYPKILDQLLANRGIDPKNAKQVEDFLNPKYAQTHDPFLFSDMSKAVERVWKAIENKEKVYIYSDYDADAVTAAAVVYRGLKFLGLECAVYIPDRFSEGYGLNLEAFEKIKAEGTSLVITVDCGTNSTAEAEFCKANGIDLIITDHHEITGDIPNAYALINPKRSGEKYPFHELTGVGVAFKFIAAIFSNRARNTLPKNSALPEGFEKWLLDLVAIGTVADCHSLLDENRVLVSYGLQVLKKTKWSGLRALLQLAGVESQNITAKTLGFTLAPRINAAGRLEHASGAFNLLIADEPLEAAALAAALDAVNKKRQLLTEAVMSEARAQIEIIQDRKILMVSGADWPKGVVGLVAGKLAEDYGKPVLVLERGEEFSTGSARSTPEFNIVEALIFSKEFLVKYGGHAAAAGFTVRTKHLGQLYQKLLVFADNLDESPESSKLLESPESIELSKSPEAQSEKKRGADILEAEAELLPEELSLQTAQSIEKLEPFGQGNSRPKFVLLNAELEFITPVGKEKQHAQVGAQAGGRRFKGIAFSAAKAFSRFQPGEHVDLLFETMVDTWNGLNSLKLRVIDMRPALSKQAE